MSNQRLLISVQDANNLKGNDSKAIMTIKEKVVGSVNKEVYIAWANAGGGASVVILILGMFVVVELLNVLSKWWLTYWSQSGRSHTYFYLGIYGLINFLAILQCFSGSFSLYSLVFALCVQFLSSSLTWFSRHQCCSLIRRLFCISLFLPSWSLFNPHSFSSPTSA